MTAHILKGLIILYARALSPLLPRSCRFYPTCSAYAVQALDRHGAVKGLALIFLRLTRCQPFTKKGFADPVPEAFDWRRVFRYKRGVCPRPECADNDPLSQPIKERCL